MRGAEIEIRRETAAKWYLPREQREDNICCCAKFSVSLFDLCPIVHKQMYTYEGVRLGSSRAKHTSWALKTRITRVWNVCFSGTQLEVWRTFFLYAIIANKSLLFLVRVLFIFLLRAICRNGRSVGYAVSQILSALIFVSIDCSVFFDSSKLSDNFLFSVYVHSWGFWRLWIGPGFM